MVKLYCISVDGDSNRSYRTAKRTGDGESPILVGEMVNITSELPAEPFELGRAVLSALQETRMLVCSNGG